MAGVVAVTPAALSRQTALVAQMGVEPEPLELVAVQNQQSVLMTAQEMVQEQGSVPDRILAVQTAVAEEAVLALDRALAGVVAMGPVQARVQTSEARAQSNPAVRAAVALAE